MISKFLVIIWGVVFLSFLFVATQSPEHNSPKVFYRDDGSVLVKTWWLGEKLHRLDGPAIVLYWVNGSVREEEWWVEGKRHRLDGPAMIIYREDGSIEIENWWVKGVLLSKEEFENLPLNKRQKQ